ncbi:MAG: right-handed parallel beta-helix repeat-containing protein [Actinomycetota bacterium]
MPLIRIILALAALGLAAPASAATYTVAPTGNDAGNGITTPFRTLKRAADAVQDGDTIQLQPGTYTAGAWIFARRVTVRGVSYADVILDGAGAEITDGLKLYQSHGSVIQDLKIRNCGRVGLFVGESHGVTVRNCELSGSAGSGLLSGHSSDLWVENCTVANNGGHGLYFSEGGDRVTVKNCRLFGNQRAGVQINANQDDALAADPNSDGISTDCRLEGNTLYGNGAAGGAAIALMGVCRSLVLNNLVYGNLAAGLTLWDDGAGEDYACKGNHIYHNTVVSTRSRGYHGIRLEAGSTDNELLNNVVFWSSGPALETFVPVVSNYNSLGGASTVNGGTLAAWRAATGNDLNSDEGDPQLGAEYHPLPTSTAIDGGVALPGVDVDRNGNPRPRGANPDRGCYEEAGAGGVAPPEPPTTPTGLVAAAGDTRVDLRWNGVAGTLAGYAVYRSFTQNGSYVRLNTSPVAVAAYTDLGLSNGLNYWYRVSALDQQGREGLLTSPVIATPAAPLNQTYTISGQVTFDGAALAGVLISAGGQTALSAGDGSYTLNGLLAGTHTVRPSKSGYTFSNKSATVGPNRSGLDFVAVVYPAVTKGETIYRDLLRSGWSASARKAGYSLQTTDPVAQGARAISLTAKARTSYLLLTGAAIPTQGQSHLALSVHGGELGGQDVKIQFRVNGRYRAAVSLTSLGGAPAAGAWKEYRIPLAALGGSAGNLTGVKVLVATPKKELFLDDIRVE